MKCRTLDTWQGNLTGRRKRSQFSSTWTNTRSLLERELKHVKARDAVLELTANQSMMRNDGWPYADARVDPPVRLTFASPHGPMVYQCDKFTTWQDNVRAIALGLEALRKIDRYGISNDGQQYQGWTQIEAKSSTGNVVGELAMFAGVSTAEASAMSFSDLVKRAKVRTHPDQGGSTADFQRVTELQRNAHHISNEEGR